MQLTEEFRDRLVAEFRYAALMMEEAESANEAMYYFSVVFGDASRVLNFEWDADLALIWMVAQQTQRAFSSRIQSISAGDRTVVLTPVFFEKLQEHTEALADWIEADGDGEDLCDILGALAELAYATTGNGHYLWMKGQIRFDEEDDK